MVTSDELKAAISEIRRLVRRQCQYGQQNHGLPGIKALGQFLEDEGFQSTQRGMYGTAAGVHVLASSPATDDQDLAKGLGSYLAVRIGNAPAAQHSPKEADKTPLDGANVIKLSESIIALRQVFDMGQEEVLPPIQAAEQRLVEGIVEGRAWPYFVGQTEAEVLPSAHALAALPPHKTDLASEAKRFVWEQISQDSTGVAADDAVAVFALLVIVQRKGGWHPPLAEVLRLFDRLWGRHEPFLPKLTEQNIEYWREDRTFYVRVPHQLHLLRLALLLRPAKLSLVPVQAHLSQLVQQAKNHTFRYPHSGHGLSTRSHAILCELLLSIQDDWRPGVRYRFYAWYDGARRLARSKPVRTVVLLMVFGLMGRALLEWLSSDGSLEDLGANVAWLLVAAMLAFGKGPR